jgi:hypothetical protein
MGGQEQLPSAEQAATAVNGPGKNTRRRTDWLRIIVYALALLAALYFGWLYWRACYIARWADSDMALLDVEKLRLQRNASEWVTHGVDIMADVAYCSLAVVDGKPVLAYDSDWSHNLAFAKSEYPKGGQDDFSYPNPAWSIVDIGHILPPPDPATQSKVSYPLDPFLAQVSAVDGKAALLVQRIDGSVDFAWAASSIPLEAEDWNCCHTPIGESTWGPVNFVPSSFRGVSDCGGQPGFFSPDLVQSRLFFVSTAAIPPTGPADWRTC